MAAMHIDFHVFLNCFFGTIYSSFAKTNCIEIPIKNMGPSLNSNWRCFLIIFIFVCGFNWRPNYGSLWRILINFHLVYVFTNSYHHKSVIVDPRTSFTRFADFHIPDKIFSDYVFILLNISTPRLILQHMYTLIFSFI